MFPSRTKIVFFGSAITGFLLQLAALYGFGQWPFLAPLLLHLTGALCFWPFSVRILPANLRERKLAGVFFGSIVFLVPCMGIVFAIGLALVFRARSFQKSERCYVFAEESVPDIFAFQSRTEVSTSILQILNSPDVSNRRKAVLALRAIEPRFALPFLRRAVQDSDEHVRIFAQGILTEIVEQFDKTIKVMEKEIAEGRRSVTEKVLLAEQYHESVYQELVMDEEIQRVQLQKAIGILEEAREEEAGHAQILYLLMRCSLRLEDVDRAERYFREWAEAVTPEAARPWRMEILYKRRDWAELRREMRAFAQAAEINPRLKQIADFWLQEEGVLA